MQSDFLPYQVLEFLFGHCVITLEHAHGLMAARRHDAKVVMTLEPPVVDGRVPQVVKSEVIKPGTPAGRNE